MYQQFAYRSGGAYNHFNLDKLGRPWIPASINRHTGKPHQHLQEQYRRTNSPMQRKLDRQKYDAKHS